MHPLARCSAVLLLAPAALLFARAEARQEKTAGAPAATSPDNAAAPLDAARLASERRVAARVDSARAQRRVHELVALGPRMGGTPSGDAAAEHLAKQLREFGLDVRVVDDPEKDAWQPSKWKLLARRRDSGEEFVLERAWPWTHSAPGRGKLELALEARADAAWLTTKVARGPSSTPLVLVDGATNIDGEYPVVSQLRPGATQACFGLSKPEGARLREWLAAGAVVELEYELEAVARRARPKTVLARLRGANSAEDGEWSAEHFLFCAHGDSDSGGPGADDNASGVATLLEIAQAWSASIQARELAPPAREVRFAIWGSEIFSTREHLGARIPAEGACLGVLNYDQAGFGSGADQLNLEPDDLPANRELITCALGVLRDHAPAASDKPGDFPARWATNRSLGGTDSYVFSGSEYFKSNARPALTLFSSAWGSPAEHKRTAQMQGESWREREKVSVDYDAYYHSSGDTPANTTDKEPWNMAWCARVGLLTAARYVERTAAEERAK